MPEIHTVDYVRGSINVVSDAERGTISLQFAPYDDGLQSIRRILKAIGHRYGGGVLSHLIRWRAGERSPFVLPSQSKPHPENPDVLRFDIGVKQGERLDSALAALLEFLRQQPGYRRTYGSPLDRDSVPSRIQKSPSRDISKSANDILREMFKRRRNNNTSPKGSSQDGRTKRIDDPMHDPLLDG